MSQPKQIGILVIATRKYREFFPQLFKSLSEKFLLNHKLVIHLFTDRYLPGNLYQTERVSLKQYHIESYQFPMVTLLRYEIFTSNLEYLRLSTDDYTFYLDVDMRIEQKIGDEILRDLVAVYHPGFYRGGGSWETNSLSTAYMEEKDRTSYYAGGFQGGSSSVYYGAMKKMRENINKDLSNGIIACWHDESHWNKYVAEYSGDLIELSPSYCMVEEKELRKQWKIDNFPPKIVALQKDHKTIRE